MRSQKAEKRILDVEKVILVEKRYQKEKTVQKSYQKRTENVQKRKFSNCDRQIHAKIEENRCNLNILPKKSNRRNALGMGKNTEFWHANLTKTVNDKTIVEIVHRVHFGMVMNKQFGFFSISFRVFLTKIASETPKTDNTKSQKVFPIYGKIIAVIYMVRTRKSNKENEEYTVLRNKISYNIKKYRKLRHYTQEELAEYANISYDFMRRIEGTSGTCGLSVYTLYKLALALNVSVDELMEIKLADRVKE